jgi:hypothetical protein
MTEPEVWPTYSIGPKDSIFALGVVSVYYARLEHAIHNRKSIDWKLVTDLPVQSVRSMRSQIWRWCQRSLHVPYGAASFFRQFALQAAYSGISERDFGVICNMFTRARSAHGERSRNVQNASIRCFKPFE